MGSESGIVIRSGGDDLNTRWAGSLPPHRFFPTRIALQDTRNPVSSRAILHTYTRNVDTQSAAQLQIECRISPLERPLPTAAHATPVRGADRPKPGTEVRRCAALVTRKKPPPSRVIRISSFALVRLHHITGSGMLGYNVWREKGGIRVRSVRVPSEW